MEIGQFVPPSFLKKNVQIKLLLVRANNFRFIYTWHLWPQARIAFIVPRML